LGVAVDAYRNIYIADSEKHRIRRVNTGTGIVTTVAGSTNQGGFGGDGGPAVEAILNQPTKVIVVGLSDLFISDEGNNRVRFVDSSSGVIITYVGTGAIDFGGENVLATRGGLFEPGGVAFDASGNPFLSYSQ